jgi:hypothetical protein
MAKSSNEYTPVKSTVFGSAVVSFACELLLLPYVVFCLVRVVHTFDLGLLHAGHLTNGDQMK